MTETKIGVFNVLGKEAVSLKDGEYLGKIQGVMVNREEQRVTGIYIKQKGILSGKTFISFSGVGYFGEHTVTIKEDYQGENPGKEVEEKDILEMPVITITGTLLGNVDSFTFDSASGIITEYILTEGILQDTFRGKGLLKGDQVSRIGKDVIIAAAEVDESQLEEVEGEYIEIKDTYPAGAEDVRETGEDAKELMKNTRDNLERGLETAKNTAEKTWQQVGQKTKKMTEDWAGVIKGQAGKLSGEAKEFLTEAHSATNKQLEKLNQVKDKWQTKLTMIQNKKQDELSDQLLEEIKNKTVSEVLYDEENKPIIQPGEVITEQVLQKAAAKGKLHELFLLAAAKDVEDQIEKVEKEQ
ncbi:MAG: PRC-barrel domain-containing protein [Peptococcaceae bacterium]